MISNSELITFKAIVSFISELGDMFSSTQRSLKLYVRLIDNITIQCESAMKTNIEVFREFCTENSEAISNKDVSLLNTSTITYSKNAFIDMKPIFDASDKETCNAIWAHLLTIYALIEPRGKALSVLRAGNNNTDTAETDFLSDIMQKIESNIDVNSTDPMEGLQSIMSSGIFSDLVTGLSSGMQNGTMNMESMMGSVRKMVQNMGDKAGDNGESVELINNMMDSLENGSGGSDMLGPLMQMMGGQGQNNIDIETLMQQQYKK